jgi:hypothetical protein
MADLFGKSCFCKERKRAAAGEGEGVSTTIYKPGLLMFLRRVNIEVDEIEYRIRIMAKYSVEIIFPDKSLVAEHQSITEKPTLNCR